MKMILTLHDFLKHPSIVIIELLGFFFLMCPLPPPLQKEKIVFSHSVMLHWKSEIRLDGFKVLGTGAAKMVYSEGDREITANKKTSPSSPSSFYL